MGPTARRRWAMWPCRRLRSLASLFDMPTNIAVTPPTTGARLSHLLAVREVDCSADRLSLALAKPDLGWPGTPLADGEGPSGMRRHATDLGLQIGDRSGNVVRKAAFVDLGPLTRVGTGFEMEIGWRAATLAPLFPVFAGRLALADGELRLEGWYAPPGGLIGRVADRVLLRIAARGTARWLLTALADAVRGLENGR